MKKRILLFFSLLASLSYVKAQDVVINKIYNSNISSGSGDVIELLVIKEGMNMQGLYLKDCYGTSTTNITDAGGRYQFTNNALWENIPAGTVIIIRRTTTTAASADTDVSDKILDVNTGDTNYFTAGTGSLNTTNNDMVVLKGGSSEDGFDNVIHAFAVGMSSTSTPAIYTDITAPKMRSLTVLYGSGFVQPANLNLSLTDYNTDVAENIISHRSPAGSPPGPGPQYGDGQPDSLIGSDFFTRNASFVALVRNAPHVISIAPTAVPFDGEVEFTITFTKSVTGVDINDFILTATGTAAGHISSVSGSGATYVITVEDVTGEGTLRLDLKPDETEIASAENSAHIVVPGYAFTSGQSYTVGQPLPVSLISFSGKSAAEGIVLTWSTATESNSSHYIIEKSVNGIFIEIGKKDAKINSSEVSNYSFTDVNPLSGTNYYKLVQYDLDGKRHELETTSVDYKLTAKNIGVYPNPAYDNFNISYSGSDGELSLFSIDGKLIQSQPVSGSITNSVKLGNNVAPGQYIIVVKTPQEVKKETLIITR